MATTATERKLLESLFEAMIYSKSLPISDDGYWVSIERNGSRQWNEKGQLLALLDIRPKQGPLLAGDAFPIWLSAEIDESNFVGGVTVNWEMPANSWGGAQANIWPHTPYLARD